MALLFLPVLRVCLYSNRTNREAELGSIHGLSLAQQEQWGDQGPWACQNTECVWLQGSASRLTGRRVWGEMYPLARKTSTRCECGDGKGVAEKIEGFDLQVY